MKNLASKNSRTLTRHFIAKVSLKSWVFLILSGVIFILGGAIPDVRGGNTDEGGLYDTSQHFVMASGEYTAERRALHESIVERFMRHGTSSANPSLIFTAGAPGAGKSTAIDAIGAAGYLDQSRYLVIDPDEIKNFIPEYARFKQIDPARAASLVHAESGIIQELLFRRAIEARKNIIVDGTLRATDYFSEIITNLRVTHPEYSTSIVLVDANEQTLLTRVAARARATGRHVPESYVVDTKRVVRESVERLRQLTDTSIEISNEGEPIITSFFKNGENVTVNLRVPLRGSRNILVDYQVDVPTERLAIDRSVGTVDQIKGNKRVIQIRSGPNLDINNLRSEFLSRIDPTQHWVVVRADDPQAAQIIGAAQAASFETILVGTADHPVTSSAVQPTFYAVASDEGELSRMWTRLVVNDAENTVKHVSLDFRDVAMTTLSAQAESINTLRLESQNQLRTDLSTRNILFVDSSQLDTSVLNGRTPILFSGASKKSWPLISISNQGEVVQAIRQSLSVLDPQRVVIVTGATDYGVERFVHQEARSRGFTVLGTVVESASAAEVGPVTHATIMGNSWFGKSRPVLQFVRNHQGAVIFMGGGEILKDEIQMARDLGTRFSLMNGPEGAANDLAQVLPERSFQGADGLVARIYREQSGLIAASENRRARDAMFREYLTRLRRTRTEVVDYNQLRAHARGRRVTVLGGYSALGYENPHAVRAQVRELMRSNGDHAMYVIGGTTDGIGQAYEWIPEIARELGYHDVKTAGIVSRNAAQYGVAEQDYVLFADTDVNQWEVQRNGRSLMVNIAEHTQGRMVYFRGGAVSTAEIEEALRRNVSVTIVNDPRIAPNAHAVAKRLISTPDLVTDGTAQFVRGVADHPSLQVVGDGNFRRAGSAVESAEVRHPSSPAEVRTEAEISEFFRSRGKRVVTFLGYSGLDYQDRPRMLRQARRVMERLNPRTTIINIGATPDGIGAVYPLAQEMGFETSGIVSVMAKEYGTPSPHVNHVFYVQDDAWGGFRPGTQDLTPTSRAMIENSDQVIAIGGGEIARDEMTAAMRRGIPTSFIQADMNHELAIRKATRNGGVAPTEFLGAAHTVRELPDASESLKLCLVGALQNVAGK